MYTHIWRKRAMASLSHHSKGKESLYQTVTPVLELNNNSLLSLRPYFSVDRKTKPDIREAILNTAVFHTKNGEQGERARKKAGAQQSGLWASMQQWNPRDLSITGRLLLAVVVGSIQARSIASLLIAMCTDNTTHALYFHVCQSLYGAPRCFLACGLTAFTVVLYFCFFGQVSFKELS